MKFLILSIVAIYGFSFGALADSDTDKKVEDAIDALQNQIATMNEAELAQMLNLDESNSDYLLTELVDKAKSLLQSAKDALKGGFDWVMCKTVAKLNPLTTFLCAIPDLQKSNASGQGYLNALKSAFGIK